MGWRYVSSERELTETYDADGWLVELRTREGRAVALEYDGQGRLTQIADDAGRTLTFEYDEAFRLVSVRLPSGGLIRYAYLPSGMLASVTYPDGALRSYLHERPDRTDLLTGVVDENGVRFASYVYDETGRVVVSEHAGGGGRIWIAYPPEGPASVSDALGTTTRFQFATIHGVTKLQRVLDAKCALCSGAREVSHDASGNVASRTDFNGNQTCYGHDPVRNLETRRIEGLPPSAGCAGALANPPSSGVARTFTTEWHAVWRLPRRIAEPGRRVSLAYNGDSGVSCAPAGASTALVCSRTEQASTDDSGAQGFAATLSGSVGKWASRASRASRVSSRLGASRASRASRVQVGSVLALCGASRASRVSSRLVAYAGSWQRTGDGQALTNFPVRTTV